MCFVYVLWFAWWLVSIKYIYFYYYPITALLVLLLYLLSMSYYVPSITLSATWMPEIASQHNKTIGFSVFGRHMVHLLHRQIIPIVLDPKPQFLVPILAASNKTTWIGKLKKRQLYLLLPLKGRNTGQTFLPKPPNIHVAVFSNGLTPQSQK